MKTTSHPFHVSLLCVVWLALPGFGFADEVTDTALLAGHSLHGEAFDEGPRQAAVLMPGMPKIDFPVTVRNPQAQLFFNQGVGQLHGFWYFEAERSFRQVAMLDPDCVMALWGMAMANVYNEKRAAEFIRKAESRMKDDNLTRRERLYLESLSKFYPNKKTPGGGSGKDQENKRHREYVRSLEQIVEEFPDDIEAKTFLVFKIWDNEGRLGISSHTATDALAKEVLAVSPQHPVQHARIHLWNGEAERRALDAAANCGQGSPGIAHMWHIAVHTYAPLQRYADAVWQQEASARVDHAYMMRTRLLPDQIHNYAHNNEWLVRNLNHLGRVSDALDLARNMIELPRHPRFNSLLKTPDDSKLNDTSVTANRKRQNSAVFGRVRLLETLVRWELWDEILRLGDTMYLDATDDLPEEARRLWALGLAHFATGDQTGGAARLADLEKLVTKQRDAGEEKPAKENGSQEQVGKTLKELRLFATLAKGDQSTARRLAGEGMDIPKERLAQVWLQLGDKERAMKLARDAADSLRNQVQPLANCADILARCGQKEEAGKVFEKLRVTAAQANLDVPVMRRLQPLAAELQLPDDWRLPQSAATDVGIRPPLDSLGPFRWQPSAAPEFTLPGPAGSQVSLSDYRGRPVIVIFYLGSACQHCVKQLAAFAPMTTRFAEAGISVMAVSTESVGGLEDTIGAGTPDALPFPVVSDGDRSVFKRYGAFDDFENMPLHGVFLVDGTGRVRWHDIGFEPFTDVTFLLGESQRLLKLSGEAHPTTAALTEPK